MDTLSGFLLFLNFASGCKPCIQNQKNNDVFLSQFCDVRRGACKRDNQNRNLVQLSDDSPFIAGASSVAAWPWMVAARASRAGVRQRVINTSPSMAQLCKRGFVDCLHLQNPVSRISMSIARGSKRPLQRNSAQDCPPCIVLLAHGASGWNDRLDTLSRLLKEAAPSISVVPLIYPYASDLKRRPPPKAELLCQFHLEKVQEVAIVHPNSRIIMAGHSMGGRVSVMVASMPNLPSQVCGVICFSYPLVGINRSVRLKPLEDVGEGCVPVFLIQGNQDSFFPKSAANLVPAFVKVFVVDGGDHGLCLRQKKLQALFGCSQDECDRALITPALKLILQEIRPPLSIKMSKQLRSCAGR